MKTNNLITAILLSLTCSVISQTTISGGMVSGTWKKTNSPYLVSAAIMVPKDSILTIEPGVRVEFQGSFKFVIVGYINAIGTENDTIVFTSANTTIGWRGFRYDQTSQFSDSSRFRYCRIEHSNVTGLTGDEMYGSAFGIMGKPKVVIANSMISNCTGTYYGVIRYCMDGTLIANNVFANNVAGSAGVLCSPQTYPVTPTIIRNNLFMNNRNTSGSTSYGGAISTWDNAIITGNTFVGNISESTQYAGGAMYCGSGCKATISGNFFSNNEAMASSGGALYIYSSGPEIVNNLFVNNTSLAGGGAIYCREGLPKIVNNTIANNKSNQGGAIAFKQCSAILRNNILWGNTASSGGQQVAIEDEASDPDFYYNDIQGGVAGFNIGSNVFYLGTYTNNIDADPLFRRTSTGTGVGFDGLSGDWNLMAASICIDSGDPATTTPAEDIAKNPRITGGLIDMGAYEWNIYVGIAEKHITNLEVYPNPAGSKIHIKGANASINSATIYSMDGRHLQTVTKTQNDNEFTVDVSNLTTGMYVVQVGQAHLKIVVNH